MTLLWPGILFILASIPIFIGIYIWMLRRRRKFALRYSSLSLVRAAIPRHSRIHRHLPFALFLLALAVLIVALARPASYITLPGDEATIVLAMDVSRSMRQGDVFPSRIEAAQVAALDFVRSQAPGTQIGIVAFSGYAEMIQPPTTDKEALRVAIESLTLGRGTAIGRGILRSLDMIAAVDEKVAGGAANTAQNGSADPNSDQAVIPPTAMKAGTYAPAIIVVLTDGVNTTGPQPVEAAQEAVTRGIRTFTIGFGTVNGEESQGGGGGGPDRAQNGDPQIFGGWFRRGLDEETLKMVAAMTGGKYYSAESANELQKVFRSLPTNLITRTETTEISVFFVAAGALVALLAIGLSLIWHPLP
jgi:Ca-activated chloride channel homolog